MMISEHLSRLEPTLPARIMPIGSMGLAYLPTFGEFFMGNVGEYTSPMAPMGWFSEKWDVS